MRRRTSAPTLHVLMVGWLLAGLLLLAACLSPPTVTPSPPATEPPDDTAGATLPAGAPVDGAAAMRPDGWTLLYLIGPDQNRAELDAAQFAPQTDGPVQIGVQVVGYASDDPADSTGARFDERPARYRRQAGQLVAEPMFSTPDLDAAGLSDFVTWGTGTLPARQTALILSGHAAVHLLDPLALEAALATGLLATGAPPIDLVILDAGFSARLDLLLGLRNVARFALVTAEPLVVSPLTSLPALDPGGSPLDARALADQIALARGSGGTPWAVVDLAQITAVADALEGLAAALNGQIGITGNSLARARQAAAVLPELEAAPGSQSPLALGALAAALIADAAVPAEVVRQAESLRQAQSAALVPTLGPVAADFPLLVQTTSESAPANLPVWNALLSTFDALAVPAPAIRLLAAPGISATVTLEQPALLRYELSGRQIDRLTLVAGLRDGARREINLYQPLQPPAGGWADGVYSGGAVWSTRISVLSNAQQSVNVTAWPVADGTLAVAGLLLTADEARVPVVVIFDPAGGRALRAWRTLGFPQPEPLPPTARFEAHRWLLGDDGSLLAEPGVALALDGLRLTQPAADPGDYFVGIAGRSLAGARSVALADITLSASQPITGFNAYVDPNFGFRLLYPQGWMLPAAVDAAGSLIASQDGDGSATLQLKIYEPTEIVSGTQPVALSAEAIKADVLAQWQDVAILYEDATTVGDEFAMRTAYGYIAADGQRSGMLLTFIHNAIGYALDIDLPAAREADLLPLSDALAAGWQFVPYALEPAASRFATVSAGDGSVIVPEGFAYEALSNGWQRYRNRGDGRTFFAVRNDALSGRDAATVARGWIDVAAEGLAAIELSDATGFALAGQAWARYDFRYTAANGAPIRGLLMSSVSDAERVVWAEAPEVEWAGFVETVLAIISTAYGSMP